jgi:hypothetical protein
MFDKIVLYAIREQIITEIKLLIHVTQFGLKPLLIFVQ